ncbi:1-acyl-sn-glycerol-3-phosphate acyltransferase [Mycobacterium vicinigordonae]|uniref:1-acyl-sn-glycerol-3-phosphate acyltransferase n=1 Tax=Mycobacterium vicinigordonae TaxID=1719132 RepID=A0A7D6HU71_9MYCO|nr:1-acyl-sn-glycerol-3-phosphate acyltransferase [Mycobacterium vicinigordonae]QLL07532.1 1-acyl-sn-glycerol-3-phosphate acyltransferase [Mycobacterium vicinigordonae]
MSKLLLDRPDTELLDAALLEALDEDLRLPDGEPPAEPEAANAAGMVLRRVCIEFVRRYHRLEVQVEPGVLDRPVLFVANHGFGGLFDLNVFAVGAAIEQMGVTRPVTALAHQFSWTVGLGALAEGLGCRPASRDSAREAFAAGHHLLVLPGGDLDAFKSYKDRNRIVFGGRSGFARLAMEHDLQIVPIVTAGAGESLLALSSGQRLARALKLDKTLRLKALPISVSVPWGLNIGAVGLLPYVPLPTKLSTRVLAPMVPAEGETSDAFAERVQSAMQKSLTDMTKNRRPFLG